MDYKVALVQGIYFLVTGIWPIISMKTFLWVTGPKTDLWLVKTVGLILAVIGGMLIYAQMTGTINPPVILLAIASALGLALVEIIYVTKRVISPIYLTDALVEFILIVWWAIDIWIAIYRVVRPACCPARPSVVLASRSDKEFGALTFAP